MTQSEIHDALSARIGRLAITVFNLEEKKTQGSLIHTRWGRKTPQGIGEMILEIVRAETRNVGDDFLTREGNLTKNEPPSWTMDDMSY
jgi:hypothetical protein